MKNLLYILFLFALPIQAQFAMPPPFSLETQEYLVQTSTKPCGQCIGKIDSVLRTLRAKDMYTLCDRIFEFAQDLSANAIIPLVNPKGLNATWPTTAIIYNSATFTANKGFTGNGYNMYVDLKFNPTTADSVNYHRFSSAFGFFSDVNIAAANKIEMGQEIGTHAAYIQIDYTGTTGYYE